MESLEKNCLNKMHIPEKKGKLQHVIGKKKYVILLRKELNKMKIHKIVLILQI